MAEMNPPGHPAPVPFLPPYPPGENNGIAPKPLLQGNGGNFQGATGVVLTWNLPNVPQTNINNFEVFFCQDMDAPGRTLFWKKLLHMYNVSFPRTVFISLPQNHRYHFIVRAEYINNSWGLFSDPVSVDLVGM